MKIFAFLFSFFAASSFLFCQTKELPMRPHEEQAQNIIRAGLDSGKAYSLLTELCVKIGSRLSGSPQAARAVEWGKTTMEKFGFENVRLESIMVPHWKRGKEQAYILDGIKKLPLTVCALGGSIATPHNGIIAEVVVVKSKEELQKLGDAAQGKIIFFNQPMDKKKITTFEAYGNAVWQRWAGAMEAAKLGAVAAIVRSMTTRLDDVPHTGSMGYEDTIPKVPAAAISTVDANSLSAQLIKNPRSKIQLILTCETLPEVPSANVVGEITGSEKPNEIIVIGGHLDSWDKGHGAHDDGAGIAHTLEALRLLKECGIRPKRTIRAVLFMNEENGGRGGKGYAEKVRTSENHLAAIETDAGGFSPRGFGIGADSATVEKLAQWSYLLEPIDAGRMRRGGGGADIAELGKQGVITIGMHVDSQRYFDYHHSDNDTIDKVNERELELGAIALAIFSYVIAEEGL